MNVFVDAPGHVSRAMFRVQDALKRHAPHDINIVSSVKQADLQVLHVLGPDAVVAPQHTPRIAVIQYCLCRCEMSTWHPLWRRADAVWSYYDLQAFMPHGATFYRAPLGIDPIFTLPMITGLTRQHVMTSGYVAGHDAEAIEEVAWAAHAAGLSTVHIGPVPGGEKSAYPSTWYNRLNIPDGQLFAFYNGALWVSGLRHVEGFELPVIEGLAQGARPIVFDRQDMHAWYDGHAEFVPECEGPELITHLMRIFSRPPMPVLSLEREEVLRRFSWETIVRGFWNKVLMTTHAAVM